MAVKSLASNHSLDRPLDGDDYREMERIRAAARRILSGWEDLMRGDFHPDVEMRLLDALSWSLTEGIESRKYKTRFRSRASIEASRDRRAIPIRHDHVVTRAWLRHQISCHRNHAAEIGDLAVACVVTKEEHDSKLKSVEQLGNSFGWERYVEAEIEVFDASKVGFPNAGPVDLRAKAAEQRSAIDVLGLGPIT